MNIYVEMGSAFLTVTPVMGTWTVAMEVMRTHPLVVKSFVSSNYCMYILCLFMMDRIWIRLWKWRSI